jgi:hypothetical protein
MKKMKLELDALCVESFATATADAKRGTVRGNDVAAATDPVLVGSDWCTDQSYQETCIFYTCGGCTTQDPDYC